MQQMCIKEAVYMPIILLILFDGLENLQKARGYFIQTNLCLLAGIRGYLYAMLTLHLYSLL